MQPGRLLPLYSSRTETKAQSCCCLFWSFCETKEKRNNTLQNQTLSILSWKPPLSMPGGRTMTISWRLDFWSCLPLKGQQQTRCSPGYFLCPIRRVEYILRCPPFFADCSNCKVSKSARTWKYAQICNICHKIFYMHYMWKKAKTCTQNRILCKTCGGFIRAWMSTWLLSSSISGRWRLAYESESNSNRYRAILSGSTDSSWYLPYSPQSPCKIFSHLKAS